MKILLIILGVVGIMISLGFLGGIMRNDFLNRFEYECRNTIKERDEEYEKEQETIYTMKKWLFK